MLLRYKEKKTSLERGAEKKKKMGGTKKEMAESTEKKKTWPGKPEIQSKKKEEAPAKD